jgi:DNA-binding beta-propeller fold protein YncE
LNRIHGIALASDTGIGLISDGGADQIIEFDLKTLAAGKKISAGKNPDGILYDGFSHQVFAFNGRSGDATVVSAEKGTVTGTIPLGSKPEFPVSDGRGNLFVNMEDTSEIIKIDAAKRTVLARWPLAPCESPSGLAIDRADGRLFSVCSNKMMAVVDTATGRVVATPSIGEGPDAAAYDPGTGLIFASNGRSGTLTVIRKVDSNHFTVVQDLTTAKGARTMALDEKTHKIFLSTAEFGATPEATTSVPHPRPAILPDSFKMLVVTPSF